MPKILTRPLLCDHCGLEIINTAAMVSWMDPAHDFKLAHKGRCDQTIEDSRVDVDSSMELETAIGPQGLDRFLELATKPGADIANVVALIRRLYCPEPSSEEWGELDPVRTK
jgi:hypothetical protein